MAQAKTGVAATRKMLALISQASGPGQPGPGQVAARFSSLARLCDVGWTKAPPSHSLYSSKFLTSTSMPFSIMKLVPGIQDTLVHSEQCHAGVDAPAEDAAQQSASSSTNKQIHRQVAAHSAGKCRLLQTCALALLPKISEFLTEIQHSIREAAGLSFLVHSAHNPIEHEILQVTTDLGNGVEMANNTIF